MAWYTVPRYHSAALKRQRKGTKRMKSWHTSETDALFEAILSLRTPEECYAFFEDACTIKEITEIAQRLKVAKLLQQGASYHAISEETGVSTATISRVNKCLAYGNGGYALAIERTTEQEPKGEPSS